MARIGFSIQDDNVIKTTYMEADQSGTVWGKDEIVLDKETFIECYEKWIKGQEASDDQKHEKLAQEPCEDCISREKVFDMIDDCNSDGLKGIFCSYADGERFKGYIKELPSVQPKVVPIAEIRFDDDKLHEIVDEAVKNIEIKYEWIPIKTRSLTEKEKAEMDTESPYMYDCPLPDDGEEVEVTTYSGDVTLDVFYRDSSDGCYFEQYCDDGDVLAWRHKPEPYKAESEAEK